MNSRTLRILLSCIAPAFFSYLLYDAIHSQSVSNWSEIQWTWIVIMLLVGTGIGIARLVVLCVEKPKK